MFFDQTHLSLGTGFIWIEDNQHFLITNWHNVSGRDPFTQEHLSKTAAEPNQLRVWFNEKGKIGNKNAEFVSLKDHDNKPRWFVHPRHLSLVDVVAVPIDIKSTVEPYPLNEMPNEDLSVKIGDEVFVLGYPFGFGHGGLPIWKRGSIASEPELVTPDQLHVFLDTASRPGMSGSPVIKRSWGTHHLSNGAVMIGGVATKFFGVYSGRLTSSDPLDAQLGLTWPAQFVAEIVAGKKAGC